MSFEAFAKRFKLDTEEILQRVKEYEFVNQQWLIDIKYKWLSLIAKQLCGDDECLQNRFVTAVKQLQEENREIIDITNEDESEENREITNEDESEENREIIDITNEWKSEEDQKSGSMENVEKSIGRKRTRDDANIDNAGIKQNKIRKYSNNVKFEEYNSDYTFEESSSSESDDSTASIGIRTK